MKLIQRLTLLSSITLLAVACDLQQTFDERIDDKQLLVLSPDFADTSVQLVFRDPETLAVIDEDFEVRILTNKTLLDSNGNEKTKFKITNGNVFFFVHPDEPISPEDPLEINIVGTFDESSITMVAENISVLKKGINTINISLDQLSEEAISELTESSTLIAPKKSKDGGIRPSLVFNYGKPIKDLSFKEKVLYYDYILDGIFPFGFYSTSKWLPLPINQRAILALVGLLDFNYVTNNPLSIAFENLSSNEWALIKDYEFTAFYKNKEGVDHIYTTRRDGRFNLRRYFEDRLNTDIDDYDVSLDSRNTSTGIELLRLEPGFDYGLFKLEYEMADDELMICKEGFNLNFDLSDTTSDVTILFRTTMSTGKTSLISYVDLSKENSTFNSTATNGPHLFTRTSNRLEFAKNAQYIFEPNIIDLGGAEACGKTFNIKLIPRDVLKKHQLNLSMRNENQNVGLALTFSALLRKQGQGNTSWETINFKQGSASVYLEEGSTYEVKLTLADEPFEFTFTNDLSLVEAAVQATKRNVTRIKDINYRIEQSADINTINAEIVFFEGQSLID
jgi:hypothetical protein